MLVEVVYQITEVLGKILELLGVESYLFHGLQLAAEILHAEILQACINSKLGSPFNSDIHNILADVEYMLDGLVYNIEDSEEDNHLYEHRQTRTHGVDAFLLVELVLLLLEPLRVASEALLELLKLRVQKTHPRCVLLCLVVHRQQEYLGQKRENDDRHCIVAADVIDQLHYVAERRTDYIVHFNTSQFISFFLAEVSSCGTGISAKRAYFLTLNVNLSGTGSIPPNDQGLQRSMRHTASREPLTAPNRFTAVTA